MFVNRIQRLSEILHFDFGLGRLATTVDADKTYAYDLRGRNLDDDGHTLPWARAAGGAGTLRARPSGGVGMSYVGTS